MRIPFLSAIMLFSLVLELAWKMSLHQDLGKQETAVIFRVLFCDFYGTAEKVKNISLNVNGLRVQLPRGGHSWKRSFVRLAE